MLELLLPKLRDLVKDRGERLVSLFRTGTDRVFMENYDARIANARLNVLRRALDSGAFSFDTPFDDDKYHELRLSVADFRPAKKADVETIRRFIKFGAYRLAFKFAASRPNVYVDFDCPEDLEYLGVKSDDIGRNIWFLTEKGYVRSSSAATYGNPMRCSPTSKLIDEVEQGAVNPLERIGGSVTQNIDFHGPNSRFNINSTDNSMNVSSISSEDTFVQMREAAQSIKDELEREKILSRITDLRAPKVQLLSLLRIKPLCQSSRITSRYPAILRTFILVHTRLIRMATECGFQTEAEIPAGPKVFPLMYLASVALHRLFAFTLDLLVVPLAW